MRRSALIPISAMLVAALMPRQAVAASPIAGTTSCVAKGHVDFNRYLPLVQSPSGRSVHFKGKLPGWCDGANVTGGSLPLDSAIVGLRGIMPEGTDCASLLGSVGIEKGKLNVRWRGTRAGRAVTLGVSQASVASASFDDGSGSFVIVTAPIPKGAFAGSTLTIAMPLGDIAEYMRICNLAPPPIGFSSLNWGPPMNDDAVTLSVQ